MANDILFETVYGLYKKYGGHVCPQGIYIEYKGKEYHIKMNAATGEYTVVDIAARKVVDVELFRLMLRIIGAEKYKPVSLVSEDMVSPKTYEYLRFVANTKPDINDPLSAPHFHSYDNALPEFYDLSKQQGIITGKDCYTLFHDARDPLPDPFYSCDNASLEIPDSLKQLGIIQYDCYTLFIDVQREVVHVYTNQEPTSGKKLGVLDDDQARSVLSEFIKDEGNKSQLTPQQQDIINNFINGKGNENIK